MIVDTEKTGIFSELKKEHLLTLANLIMLREHGEKAMTGEMFQALLAFAELRMHEARHKNISVSAIHCKWNPARLYQNAPEPSEQPAEPKTVAVKDAYSADGKRLMGFRCASYCIENGVLSVFSSENFSLSRVIASFPTSEICGCWYEDAVCEAKPSPKVTIRARGVDGIEVNHELRLGGDFTFTDSAGMIYAVKYE